VIGVGFRKRGKITLEASYNNNELETAVTLGKSLSKNSKGEVIVFLYKKNKSKVKILKRIKLVRAGLLGMRRRIAIT